MRVYLIFLLHKWILCTEKVANFDRSAWNWFLQPMDIGASLRLLISFLKPPIEDDINIYVSWEKEARHEVHKTD